MGTTSLGIPYPENTDLVKDGAADMQALADAANDLYGLIHIETTAIPTAASQSFSSFVDNSKYAGYRVVVNFYTSVNGADLRFRFRDTGDITTGYYGSGFYTAFNGTTGNIFPSNNGNAVRLADSTNLSTSPQNVVFDIFSADSNKTKFISGQAVSTYGGWGSFFGFYELASGTALGGFTLFASSGNITGNATIFGYKK